MKIQIYNPQNEQPIEGFTCLQFLGGDLSGLDEICCDSEAEILLAPNIFSQVPIQFIADVAVKLASKIRIGGELVVGGFELNAFADAVIAEEIDAGSASELVRSIQSLVKVNELVTVLEPILPNFTWFCEGVNYECRWKRNG